jgi:hypothetical protein
MGRLVTAGGGCGIGGPAEHLFECGEDTFGTGVGDARRVGAGDGQVAFDLKGEQVRVTLAQAAVKTLCGPQAVASDQDQVEAFELEPCQGGIVGVARFDLVAGLLQEGDTTEGENRVVADDQDPLGHRLNPSRGDW